MVGTAAAALTSAHKLQPEAMLVDVGLPDRDGIDLARELAGLPWQPRIVLTSTDRDAVAGALEDGSPPFIAKEDLPDAPLLRSLLGGGR
jgi:CheY-like chemotaxis protein